VAVLGGLGAIVRVLLTRAVQARAGGGFPVGTLLVNVSGALALGLLAGLAASGDLLVLAGGATLGSYTTFSTWMLEIHRLSEAGRPRAAALNVALSLAAGVAAALLGKAVGAGL
jgi:CrcB protein